MRNLFLIAANTLRVTFRKKVNLIVFFILPVALILLSTFIYSSADQKITVGINNKDANSVLAKDMIESIRTQDKYKIQLVEENEINNTIAEGKIDCVITIPEGFEESIYNHSLKRLQITAVKGQEVTGWIQNYVNYYLKNLMDISRAAEGNKETFNKLYEGYKNESLKVEVNIIKDKMLEKYTLVQSIGFLILLMLQSSTSTTGFILKEKKERTYFRICSAPVSSRIYIGGNIMANMVIVIIQSIIVVLSLKYIFKLSTGITDMELLVILIAFGLVSVAFGVLLVAFSRTSSQAGNMATLIITPTCMLSGCFWPVEVMPSAMQKLGSFLPQKWTLEAINQLQNGKAFVQVIPIIGVVLAFALAFFLIGAYKMRINDSVKSFV